MIESPDNKNNNNNNNNNKSFEQLKRFNFFEV